MCLSFYSDYLVGGFLEAYCSVLPIQMNKYSLRLRACLLIALSSVRLILWEIWGKLRRVIFKGLELCQFYQVWQAIFQVEAFLFGDG